MKRYCLVRKNRVRAFLRLAACAVALFITLSFTSARAENSVPKARQAVFKGTILIRIMLPDHEFVLPLPSERVVPLKRSKARMSETEFKGMFTDYFEGYKKKQKELIEVLRDRMTKENIREVQEVFDKEYASALEVAERYPDDENDKDGGWNKYFKDYYQDVTARDGSFTLKHIPKQELFPNSSMTHAIYSFDHSSITENFLLDLHTLKMNPLIIGSYRDKPSSPFGWSPDGRLLAYAVKRSTELPRSIVVLDVQNNDIVFSRTFEYDLEEYALAWSPDSRALSLVTRESRMGKGPLELLFAYAGHPVPHNTFHLHLLDVGSGEELQYIIKRNVKYGMVSLLWLGQDE